jgi:hypothetical protein
MVADVLDEQEIARRVCEACVAGLDVDGAAISVQTAAASRRTLWATDWVVVVLEDLQFTLNEGVCVEAATSGLPVIVEDLGREGGRRWPVFAAEVAERTPAQALFALPLRWGAVTIGVLDLYRLRTGGLAAGQWQDLLRAVEVAALLLLGVRTRPRPDSHVVPGAERVDSGYPEGVGEDWMNGGLFRRPEIHQATGMVLAQLGIGPEEALARMRALAYGEQRLLIDVARDVVARRMVFTEEMK